MLVGKVVMQNLKLESKGYKFKAETFTALDRGDYWQELCVTKSKF
jgi:hypothetical protein